MGNRLDVENALPRPMGSSTGDTALRHRQRSSRSDDDADGQSHSASISGNCNKAIEQRNETKSRVTLHCARHPLYRLQMFAVGKPQLENNNAACYQKARPESAPRTYGARSSAAEPPDATQEMLMRGAFTESSGPRWRYSRGQVLLTSRNCTRPSSPSSATQAYAASLWRNS